MAGCLDSVYLHASSASKASRCSSVVLIRSWIPEVQSTPRNAVSPLTVCVRPCLSRTSRYRSTSIGRILELLPLPLGSGDDRSRIEIEEVLDKHVGVLRLKSERLQYVGREVLLVEGHDHVGVTANRGREDVPVIGVRKGQAADKNLMPRHQRIGNGPVHQVRGSVDLLGAEVMAVLQHAALPFVMDLSAPACTESPGLGEPHQEVPQRR